MAAILDAQGLNKNFGAVTAASDINAAIERDSVVGLIGTNGAGKTTFINMITGYLKPDRGRIRYEGRDITELAPRDVTRLGICRSFQIPQLYASLTAFENMLVGIGVVLRNAGRGGFFSRSEEHTSELQSRLHLVCRLLLEKKKKLRGRAPRHPLSPQTT